MAKLHELVASLASDDACMVQLSRRCGLSSPQETQRAYEAASGVVRRRLAEIGRSSEATKSLLRSVRTLQRTNGVQPRAQFGSAHVVGDEIVHEVFGTATVGAVGALAGDLAIQEDQARTLLEITTAVVLSAAVELVGEDMGLDALSALVAAERDEGVDDGVGTTGAGAGGANDRPLGTALDTPGEKLAAPDGGRRGGVRVWMVAAPAAALVAGGALWLASGGDDDATLAFAEETTTEVDPAQADSADAEAETTTTGPASAADDTAASDDTVGSDEPVDADDASLPDDLAADDPALDEAPSDEADPGVASPPVPIGAPFHHAVMSQGRIFLRGYVSSAEEQAQIVAAIEQVVGPGNAIGEYVVDPLLAAEEDDTGTPVYIEDTVLFTTGSAEIAPDFEPLLAVGLRLLQVQPGVTLEVTGHTDSLGSDAANLALSQNRVDAVKEFFVAQGIAPERIVAVGKGEAEPRADNDTPEGRQANRRVEFLVKGFSYGA